MVKWRRRAGNTRTICHTDFNHVTNPPSPQFFLLWTGITGVQKAVMGHTECWGAQRHTVWSFHLTISIRYEVARDLDIAVSPQVGLPFSEQESQPQPKPESEQEGKKPQPQQG